MRYTYWRILGILKDILIGVILTAIIVFGIELFFYWLNSKKVEDISTYEGGYMQGYFQDDEILGYKPPPNTSTVSTKKVNGKVVYNIIYTVDEYSRRITPETTFADKDKFILFFGGSFTVGEGVENNETLPYYISQLAGKYRAYNYGFHGYGPQQMLAHLQKSNFPAEIKENDGILIYTFIDPHISRAIGAMSVYTTWGKDMPYYTFEANKNLVRYGSFSTGRPFLSTVYSILGGSQTVKYFGFDFPQINESHIELTAAIIEESRNNFKDKFGGEEFYVVFYPTISYNYSKRLIPYLEKAGIKYLDYSALPWKGPEFQLEGDPHPNPNAYRSLAELITKDLKLSDNEAER